MGFNAAGWFAGSGGGPLVHGAVDIPGPGPDDVVVEVAACGLCHTDLGFAQGKVAPKHALPLVLGHEIVGTVVACGERATAWKGAQVLVPAVLPCGKCAYCQAGRGNACPQQKMPGNDIHGGFASHVVVPSGPLVRVDGFKDAEFRALGVVADAVSTAYQAVRRAGLTANDLAIVVGAGGVGAFTVQVAAALGARVVALDVNEDRLTLSAAHGATRTVMVGDPKATRKQVLDMARQFDAPPLRHKIFECSGTTAGQELAWSLMGHGCTLVFVGYTIEKIQLRVSNLMAFDATAHGTWGCPPEAYGPVLEMVKHGKIALAPFIEEGPMAKVNDYLGAMANHTLQRRMVLIP